jgi:hypothetical protein
MPKGVNIAWDVRNKIVRMYEHDGMTIREIMVATGRSFGGIHGVLTRAKVEFRPRGKHKKK